MSRAVLRKRKRQLKKESTVRASTEAIILLQNQKASAGQTSDSACSTSKIGIRDYGDGSDEDNSPHYDEQRIDAPHTYDAAYDDGVNLGSNGLPFTAFDSSFKTIVKDDADNAAAVPDEYDVSEMSLQDILSLEDAVEVTSVEKASLLLKKLLHPAVSVEEFWSQYWEKKPLVVKEGTATKYKRESIFSQKSFMGIVSKQLLREGTSVQFVQNGLPISSSRDTDDDDDDDDATEAEGREVGADEVQKHLSMGNPVQLHNPQQYNDMLWKLLSAMEFGFHSHISSTAVLSHKQQLHGEEHSVHISAPFFESTRCTFVLQLQGSSRWRLVAYDSISKTVRKRDQASSDGGGIEEIDSQLPMQSMYLPDNAISSVVHKYSEDTIDEVLHAGDVLYIPKEFVHEQQRTDEGSMHIQINIGGNADGSLLPPISSDGDIVLEMNNTIGSLLQIALPQAIGAAIQNDRRLRCILPRGIQKVLGVAAATDDEDVEINAGDYRTLMQQHIKSIFQSTVTMSLKQVLDPAADQLMKRFIAQRLPVPLSHSEEVRSAAGAPNAVIYPYTKLRILRPGIAVATVENARVVLYHCMDNARYMFGSPTNPLEFELDDGPAIELLLDSYPDGVIICDLPHPSEEMEEKVAVAQALYKEGIFVIEDEASNPATDVIGVRHKKDKRDSNVDDSHAQPAKKKTKKKHRPGAAIDDDDDPF